MPIMEVIKKTTYLITDSTDIALAIAAVATQSNVGAAFNAVIPVNGLLRLAAFSGQILNNAVAASHSTFFGIKISGVNYWFNVGNSAPTLSTASALNTGTGAGSTMTYNGVINDSGAGDNIRAPVLDIVAAGIPAGYQSIQLIAGYIANQTTLKGTTKQTRIKLEILE